MRNIIDQCYKKAKELLANNMDKLIAMTEALLEREVLDREDVERIMRGEKLVPVKQFSLKPDEKKGVSLVDTKTTNESPQPSTISSPSPNPKVLPA